MATDRRLNSAHADAGMAVDDEAEHSVIEDDSDEGEMQDEEYDDDDDDDGSSSLSIPNESIDFDLVYSLHSFAATVEGQANVVKGDSLILMDDSNSYWWLVRVLKTQEVGYIPAENIETPFERLARLNKHRNVDLASATQQEMITSEALERARLGADYGRVTLGHWVPVNRQDEKKASKAGGIAFLALQPVHRYPPFIWFPEEEEWEEDDVEWDVEPYEREDAELAEDAGKREDVLRARVGLTPLHSDPQSQNQGPGALSMEPDDGMAWDESAAQQQQQNKMAERKPAPMAPQLDSGIPAALQSGSPQQGPYARPPPQQQQTQLQTQSQVDQERVQRERVISDPTQPESQRRRNIDPLEHGDTTLKISPTPGIVREAEADSPTIIRNQQQDALQRQQQQQNKRRLEEETSEAQKRAKIQQGQNIPVASQQQQQQTPRPAVGGAGGKLRKENGSIRSNASGDSTDEDKGGKQKKPGLMESLFKRGKKKEKDKTSSFGSSAEGGAEGARGSTDSGTGPRGSESVEGAPPPSGMMSPTTGLAMQQQQQMTSPSSLDRQAMRNSTNPKNQGTSSMQQQLGPQASEHSSQLRQRDKDQQALYLQYLKSSPSSVPDPVNHGLMTASSLGKQNPEHAPSGSSGSYSSGLGPPEPGKRARPGSLILTPNSPDGAHPVPELSVIRVFAGSNLQTEATFKTVLLNTSTTSSELVKQAIQRFRLPLAELADEASLSSYYLLAKQVEGGASLVLKPDETPLSVFEELNKHATEVYIPTVKRASVGSLSSLASNLSMHPAIEKLPMNDFTDDSAVRFYLNRRGGPDDDEMNGFLASRESLGLEGDDTLIAASDHDDEPGSLGGKYLSVNTNNNVPAERFSSPSFRFPLQLVIFPEDLPDNMLFDPLTEAIIFKDTLRERGGSNRANSGVNQDMRRKVFVFPKNVTVAEVIELGLERFGILEGVVDGGDEVEDKSNKRRSMSRVRYNLQVEVNGTEKELFPSSKVIDAYPQPPTYKAVDRKFQDNKRRSVDSTMLLGTMEDVGERDPVFILRRATAYRSSQSRNGLSRGPLDELALSQKRNSIGTAIDPDDPKNRILAQRKALADRQQRAILNSQANSVRGVDVLLPGNVVLRSSRRDAQDAPRYSIVEADGEEYDVSRFVEEELRNESPQAKSDLLQGILSQNKDGMAKLDRVMSKVKSGRLNDVLAREDEDGERTRTPQQYTRPSFDQRPGSRSTMSTPTGPGRSGPRRQTSDSDISVYATPTSQLLTSPLSDAGALSRSPQGKGLFLPRDDFGIPQMLSVIECRALKPASPLPPLDHVDDLLFGRPLDSVTLHPEIKDIYADSFKQLEDMDKYLDNYLHNAFTARS